MIAQDGLDALNTWLAQVGLRGESEVALVSGFCERAVAAGLPIGRALVIIDTLHPVYEGRLFRWGYDASQPAMREYGRTGSPESPSGLQSPPGAESPEAVARWRASPFFRMLQTGESLLRRRVTADGETEFPVLRDYRMAGMTDYVAMINRFGPDGTIGEMDCMYSSWVTAGADGFADEHIAALTRLVPTLALAVKTAALARIAVTLVETYLGRDAGRRVLAGLIRRGVADRINAVLWFSDLRGFTRISEQAAPQQIIPLLNDYAEAVISAIYDNGGDVLKLIGDGTLAIFAAPSEEACRSAIAAHDALQERVAQLNQRRAGDSLPTTHVYVGLHLGDVFYGNIGSEQRLDFTVVGPAVNEAARIAAMCRSVERNVLLSQAFADAMARLERGRLVSVGRYALRGLERPQELFTLDPFWTV